MERCALDLYPTRRKCACHRCKASSELSSPALLLPSSSVSLLLSSSVSLLPSSSGSLLFSSSGSLLPVLWGSCCSSCPASCPATQSLTVSTVQCPTSATPLLFWQRGQLGLTPEVPTDTNPVMSSGFLMIFYVFLSWWALLIFCLLLRWRSDVSSSLFLHQGVLADILSVPESAVWLTPVPVFQSGALPTPTSDFSSVTGLTPELLVHPSPEPVLQQSP